MLVKEVVEHAGRTATRFHKPEKKVYRMGELSLTWEKRRKK
jgi:hypothetical protein